MMDPLVKSAELAAAAGVALTRHQRWALMRRKILQLLGGLIMEKNEDGLYVISIGRVAWWMAFLPAIGIWIAGGGKLDAGDAVKDISPNHFNMLVLLAGYNFGKKITDIAKVIFSKKSGTATNTEEETETESGEKEESDGPG